MANQKISELTTITDIDNADLLAIVDISATQTKKATVTQIKALAPVQSVNGDVGDVTVQETLVSGTNIKTINSTSLLGSGNIDVAADWGDIGGTLADQTDLQSALDGKQDTLVSGTNIKTVNSTSLLGSGNVSVQETLVSGTNIRTINSTSLLGSGDISIQANPSGGAGAIQFSDGSAFASDSNLFWDNSNKRLGVGTNAPISGLTINTSETWVSAFNSNLRLNANSPSLQLKTNTGNGGFMISQSAGSTYFSVSTHSTFAGLNHVGNITNNNWSLGSNVSNLGAALGVRGSGSTSATTALLVQNSAGTNALTVRDDGVVLLGQSMSGGNITTNFISAGNCVLGNGNPRLYTFNANNVNLCIHETGIVVNSSNYTTPTASAILQANSTTKGFLPPRMTTTEKNAIASPASGLQVYDTTLNQMSYYNGTSWINF